MRRPRHYDLNCDLGEHEPARMTSMLMLYVSSCNIACGGHAGTVESMSRAVGLAREQGVHIGAHPGTAEGFGREPAAASVRQFSNLLLHQVSALHIIVREQKARLHHIKLHGALYHMVEREAGLRRSYISLVKRYWPQAWIYCLSGGLVARDAEAAGIRVKHEVFLDRHYQPNGSLVPRTDPNAVICDPEIVFERVRSLLHDRTLPAIDGSPLELRVDTCCVHGDTPGAVALLREISPLMQG